jgi:phage recombination protein Bet
MSAVVKDPAPALPAKKQSLVTRIAAKYEIDADKMLDTMKATCFRQRGDKQVSNEQMMALLVVAEQFNLNPFTKEIYAFPTDGGIAPIIGFDGWIRIINEHPQFDSMELAYAPEGSDSPWIECTIWRRDRSRPVTIREYMDECQRDTGPWKSHPRRMLRHKAIIQCARVAFGFGGAYDPDEGERIANAIDVTPHPSVVPAGKPKTTTPRAKVVNEVHPEPDAPLVDPTLDAEPTQRAGGLTAAQIAALRDKLDAEGVEESLILAKFEVGSFEEIDSSRFKLVMNSIG